MPSKKIRKKVASFLSFREDTINLFKLEEKFKVKLPPIFRSFIQNFNGISGDVYLNEKGELKTLSYYEYYAHRLNNKNLMFTEFLETEEIFESYDTSDIWVENKVIPISHHDHGGTILVGISEENQDKLYFEYGNGLEYIEDNIFSFLKNLNFVLDYIEPDKKVYMNFGEDFWRVKSNKDNYTPNLPSQ